MEPRVPSFQNAQYNLLSGIFVLKVGWKTVRGKLHCLCTHLSAFGGSIFVAPNPIDFNKVLTEFKRLDETGNFVVLSSVCLIFGIYLIGLVFAHQTDKKDLSKV